MITIARYPIDQILPLLDGQGILSLTVGGQTFSLDTASKRYRVFRKSKRCACCGDVGVELRLERHDDAQTPHFNAYTACGVMLTKDHITPRSRGGSNDLSNLQTMCALCNGRKGNRYITVEALRAETILNGGKVYV